MGTSTKIPTFLQNCVFVLLPRNMRIDQHFGACYIIIYIYIYIYIYTIPPFHHRDKINNNEQGVLQLPKM